MRSSLLLVVFAAVAVGASPAVAADYQPSRAVIASPASSPLLDPCPFQAETATQENFKDTEVEPLVAVNPTNPQNVIGVFQEDRWSDGGAHGLLGAVSFNGGLSYVNDWGGVSACSDRPETPGFEHLPRAAGPGGSFGGGGGAYQVRVASIDGRAAGGAGGTERELA